MEVGLFVKCIRDHLHMALNVQLLWTNYSLYPSSTYILVTCLNFIWWKHSNTFWTGKAKVAVYASGYHPQVDSQTRIMPTTTTRLATSTLCVIQRNTASLLWKATGVEAINRLQHICSQTWSIRCRMFSTCAANSWCIRADVRHTELDTSWFTVHVQLDMLYFFQTLESNFKPMPIHIWISVSSNRFAF